MARISRGRVHASQVRQCLPWLYRLYRGYFLELAGETCAERVVPALDDRYGVVLNVQRGTAMRFECHVDSNPLTGLLFCTDHPAGTGGELVFAHDPARVWRRDVEKDCSVLRPHAGHLIFFDGRRHPHYARPLLAEPHVRIVAVMNFYTDSCPESTRPPELNRHLFGRAAAASRVVQRTRADSVATMYPADGPLPALCRRHTARQPGLWPRGVVQTGRNSAGTVHTGYGRLCIGGKVSVCPTPCCAGGFGQSSRTYPGSRRLAREQGHRSVAGALAGSHRTARAHPERPVQRQDMAAARRQDHGRDHHHRHRRTPGSQKHDPVWPPDKSQQAGAVHTAGHRQQALRPDCGLGAALLDWAADVAQRDYGAELIRYRRADDQREAARLLRRTALYPLPGSARAWRLPGPGALRARGWTSQESDFTKLFMWRTPDVSGSGPTG